MNEKLSYPTLSVLKAPYQCLGNFAQQVQQERPPGPGIQHAYILPRRPAGRAPRQAVTKGGACCQRKLWSQSTIRCCDQGRWRRRRVATRPVRERLADLGRIQAVNAEVLHVVGHIPVPVHNDHGVP
jgi:hypothetical protein